MIVFPSKVLAESSKKLVDGNEDLPMNCTKNYAKGDLKLQKHIFRFFLFYSASKSVLRGKSLASNVLAIIKHATIRMLFLKIFISENARLANSRGSAVSKTQTSNSKAHDESDYKCHDLITPFVAACVCSERDVTKTKTPRARTQFHVEITLLAASSTERYINTLRA